MSDANLYINCSRLERWQADDRALQVVMRDQAPRLFPLARLARVVFIGTPGGEIRSLTRLLAHQIHVAIFRRDGRLLGAFHAPATGPSLLPDIAERLAYDRVLQSWFQDWERNQQAHVASLARRERAGLPGDRLGRGEAMDWLEGLAQVQWQQIASEYGLSSQSGLGDQLLRRLEGLWKLWLEAKASQLLQRYRNPGERKAVRYFADIDEDLESQQRRLLVQLEAGAQPWL